MTITRRGLHEENSLQDKIIDAANLQKSTNFKAYREQLQKSGHAKLAIKSEIEAFKKAERKLRALKKNPGDARAQDELVDEIVAELQEPERVGTRNAPPARRAQADKAPAKESTKHQSPGSDKAPNQRPNRQGKTAPPSTSVVDAIGIGTGVDPGELLDPIKLITESLSPGDDGDVRGSPFDRNRVEA